MSLNSRIYRAKYFRAIPPDKDGYYICAICAAKLHKDDPNLTIDHIVDRNLGGAAGNVENLQPACWYCNQTKWRIEQDIRAMTDDAEPYLTPKNIYIKRENPPV